MIWQKFVIDNLFTKVFRKNIRTSFTFKYNNSMQFIFILLLTLFSSNIKGEDLKELI